MLTVFNKALKVAVDWDVIDTLPCRITLLPVPPTEAAFYSFGEFARLTAAAEVEGAESHVLTLLGGDAGLRCGEMMALRWSDLDFERCQLVVQRSTWKGHVGAPKGGRSRVVPLTQRLASALIKHRHRKSPTVLCTPEGEPLTQKMVRRRVIAAAQRAELVEQGVHILRHTFCSHLAMKGAPPVAIQKLAGHADLTTTQRYMHLSPAILEGAIELLDQRTNEFKNGADLERGPSTARAQERRPTANN